MGGLLWPHRAAVRPVARRRKTSPFGVAVHGDIRSPWRRLPALLLDLHVPLEATQALGEAPGRRRAALRLRAMPRALQVPRCAPEARAQAARARAHVPLSHLQEDVFAAVRHARCDGRRLRGEARGAVCGLVGRELVRRQPMNQHLPRGRVGDARVRHHKRASRR
jgi:hypothetical protein